jgi:energy-coupling factor transporter ATP-binding protein EcfA2
LETLLFAANLRLPETIPKAVKEQRAHTVLAQLGLTDVAHTRVGSVEHRGISGGEMRRVSIGIELVAAPDVLVLDEPTSGLDSVSASRLIKLLKNLAEDEETKTTIIASIHQPSSALYHSFSQVVLLSNGKQLYFGPGGSRPAEFFASQGRPCPIGYNIADHLLEIASGSTEGLLTGQAAMLDGSRSASSVATGSHTPEEADGSDMGRASARPGYAERSSDETPMVEKGLSYPPTTLLKGSNANSQGDSEVDLSRSGSEDKKEWWPKSHCATTFLTQIEILSGREWRNLKR